MTIKKLFTERKTVFCLLLSFLSAFSVTYCFFDFDSYSFFSLVFTPFIFAFIRRVDVSQINITSKSLTFVLSALLSVSFYLTNDMAGKMDAVFSSVITISFFCIISLFLSKSKKILPLPLVKDAKPGYSVSTT